MWFTQCGLSPPEKLLGSSFLLSNKMKGYNLQLNRWRFLFFLSQYPLSEYKICDNTQPQFNSLIREGVILEKKTLKINFIVGSATL